MIGAVVSAVVVPAAMVGLTAVGGGPARATGPPEPNLTLNIDWGGGAFPHYTMLGSDGTLMDGGVLYLAPTIRPLLVTIVLDTNPFDHRCATGRVRLERRDGGIEAHDVAACSLVNAAIGFAERPSSSYRGVCATSGRVWQCPRRS